MSWLKRYGPSILMHFLGLLPLLWLAWDAWHGNLTADPIRGIQLRTGRYAIILLVVSLAVTPLNAVFKVKWFPRLRRLSGLYAFGYAGLHLLNFIGVDYQFNLTFLRDDIFNKSYAIAGLAAFLCMVPLAITSTSGWQRRLNQRWKTLHRLVYLAALLAVVHFFWQAKLDIRLPMVFAVMVIVLLVVRLPFISNAMNRAGRLRRQDS